ncbi:hypothetical protein T02_11668 [Trichinella nativa]|uniref:Uncharacterized protein n=1 Tax=Trichinella nativa TaxID=6335 RepID=A0A0V1KZD3_9BILA|nr:hypothetical protein T02_11668 [Trichinella nativa]
MTQGEISRNINTAWLRHATQNGPRFGHVSIHARGPRRNGLNMIVKLCYDYYYSDYYPVEEKPKHCAGQRRLKNI